MTEEQHHGLIANVSSKLIQALPGQMLLVVILNLAFLGGLFWLLAQQNASRERALLPLLDACSKTIPLEAFPHGVFPNGAPAKP